jgi:hypothetical protein
MADFATTYGTDQHKGDNQLSKSLFLLDACKRMGRPKGEKRQGDNPKDEIVSL